MNDTKKSENKKASDIDAEWEGALRSDLKSNCKECGWYLDEDGQHESDNVKFCRYQLEPETCLEKGRANTMDKQKGPIYTRYEGGKVSGMKVAIVKGSGKSRPQPRVANWIRATKGTCKRAPHISDEDHYKILNEEILHRRKVKPAKQPKEDRTMQPIYHRNYKHRCPVLMVAGNKHSRCTKTFDNKYSLRDHIRDKHKMTPAEAYGALGLKPSLKRVPRAEEQTESEQTCKPKDEEPMEIDEEDPRYLYGWKNSY